MRSRSIRQGEGERQRAGGRGSQGEGERQRAGGRGSVRTLLVGVALASLIIVTVWPPAGAQVGGGPPQATITGDVGAPGTPMSDKLYGIFYEDINHAADGGLYAELVQNRSFEFNSTDNGSYDGLTAWEVTAGDAAVESADPLNDNNRNYVRVDVADAGAAFRNAGFNTGLAVDAGEGYDLSFWARTDAADAVDVRVTVEDDAGTTVYAATDLQITSDAWRKYEAAVKATGTTTAGRLAVTIEGAAAGTTVDFDMVSLFPQDTFKGRRNGLRRDLAEAIAALNPSFLRFPGGCLVNAGSFEPFPERQRVYNWKDTIGPVEERPTNANFWGYNQSYGLGYLEYFQFAEDLGAEPLPVVPVGVNGCGSPFQLTTPEQLAPWVQDTLDLIEFANGGVDTEWGARRAELGHPEPFDLEYIGLGNEEYDPQFYENYPLFHDAIREAYPDIKIISNSGTASAGAVFDRSWQFAREQGADLVDEHYYNNPAWFLGNTHRYDDYDRDGPHVFVGEYASQGNTFFNALTEAAYMTGLERNADVVEFASYAPLLANADYVNWAPDLIWFDNHRIYGSTSYHVQKLFSENRGDTVAPTTLEADADPVSDITGGVGVATWNTQAAYDNVTVTAGDGTVLLSDDFSEGAAQWTPTGPAGTPVGTWDVVDGEYQQTEIVEDARSVAGDADWSNYTLELDARKVGGAEGFLVMFGVRDTGNFYWWNLGGWNNTTSGIEVAVNGAKSTVAGSDHTIEAGRTYHIRITVEGRRIRTWLDGELVHDFIDASGVVEPLYHVVTRDEATGDVVLKVVNARDTTVRTRVRLDGPRLARTGTVTTMIAESLDDENSFDEPTKVVPVETTSSRLGNRFTYDFPANSITFIRLGRK